MEAGRMDNTMALAIELARGAVEQEKQEEKDRARVLRHLATKPRLILSTLLTPEKRAYMKRFGSRPAKKGKKYVQVESNQTS
jgi:hypothetical protein